MRVTHTAATDRRTLLTAVGSGLAVGLAGCLGNGDDLPAAVSLDDGQECDQCGMVIDQHPGPTGQVFFDDHPDHDGPAQFCSVTCTYSHRFTNEDEGYEPIVTYLTDYSDVEYSVDEPDEDTDAAPSISAHLEADGYREESELSVVFGSDVEGAMGPELIPFSDTADAEGFAEEYGGDMRAASDIDRELVDSI